MSVKVNGVASTTAITTQVEYKYVNTPQITNITPRFASVIGGDTITFTGTNFASPITVTLDGIPCVVNGGSTATSFSCVAGAKSNGGSNDGTKIIVRSGAN